MYDIAERVVLSRQEKKYSLNHIIHNLTPSAAGVLYPLMNVGQGPLEQERTGDSIICTSLRIRYNFTHTYDPAIYLQPATYRIIVFQWKLPAAVAPTAADILQDVTSTGFLSSLSTYNTDNMKSGAFTILHDRSHTIDNTDTRQSTGIFEKKLNLRFVRKAMQFAGPTATQPNNGINVLMIGSTTTGASPQTCTIHFMCRAGWTDS